MNIVRVASVNAAELAPYRDLKNSSLSRSSGRFIAEGLLVLQRLLQSSYEVESILIRDDRLEVLSDEPIPEGLPVYAVPLDEAQQLTGFNFASGVLACGLRRKTRWQLSDIVNSEAPRPLLVACSHVQDPHNLGGIMRLSRAFGVAGVLLGNGTSDPFCRRTIRVSMGNVFELKVIECRNLKAELKSLREEFQVDIAATTLNPTAEPLSTSRRAERQLLLFGNETLGLDDKTLAQCSREVTIPMHGGTDSLNVTIAAGIFLYHFAQC